MSADAIIAAIHSSKVAEVIHVKDGDTQVQVTHRVKKKRLKVWLGIIEHVLVRKQGWEAHVCKHYFMKDSRLKYAWNFIVQWAGAENAEAVKKQVAALLAKAAREVPQMVHQLDSYPLAGAKEGRNVPGGPLNPRAPGPMTGGYKQKGAHKIAPRRS